VALRDARSEPSPDPRGPPPPPPAARGLFRGWAAGLSEGAFARKLRGERSDRMLGREAAPSRTLSLNG